MCLRLVSSLALAAALLSASAKADPMVIPGVYGAQPAAATAPEPAPRYVAPQPAQQSGGLGGGFIEMVVTGMSGGGAPRRAPAPRPSSAVASGPAGAAVAPDGRQRVLYGAPAAASPERQYVAYAGPSAPAATEARREVDPMYLRTEVDYSGEAPGTIVIDTPNRYLYLVEKGGRARRYGIGVGRPGFEWSGVKTISRKAEWPDWTPPPEMLKRRPDLPRFMPGGPANPLGARAMYLGSSMYRIHGTNEPYTIGQNVSSGCIRMMNDDVTDLYERVQVGTRVIVR
jgi:lipoprotein-anchoring transpeptidase ErfK/SrfK